MIPNSQDVSILRCKSDMAVELYVLPGTVSSVCLPPLFAAAVNIGFYIKVTLILTPGKARMEK
jgi:hypothetical protein